MTGVELPDGVLDRGVIAGQDWITVPREHIRETMTRLRAEGYESYVFMTCADHLATPVLEKPPARYELVYQLRDMRAHHELRVRVFVPEDDPRAPSVHDIYPPANWDERETWDLFGIVFDGHPALTRILMPDEWEGHPLRKDYPIGRIPVQFKDAPGPR